MPTLRIEIAGKIPSKKNQLVPRRDGRGYFNPESRRLADIVAQICEVTGNLQPVSPSEIRIHLRLPRTNMDIDNRAVTIMDCLVKSGIIIDDSIRHFRGPLIVTGEKTDTNNEGASVTIIGEHYGQI